MRNLADHKSDIMRRTVCFASLRGFFSRLPDRTNLFDLSEVLIEQVSIADEITLTLRPPSQTACCPSCGTEALRIQSRYARMLHDLPLSGRPVHLIIHVRRFFCKKPTCPQKIFAEQLPTLCLPHAQRTKRLQEALCQLGLAIGGQAGARIGEALAISGSRDTILRLVRTSELPVRAEPRIIGLDDWAWKRRVRYGTLICDLEQGLPLDLLPDRSVESVSAWLQAHPSIEIVSRDGSSEYASAIKKGAPQARQVSDRWHLGKDLSECVSTLLASILAELRWAAQEKATSQERKRPPQPDRHQSETAAVQQAQRARQAERTQRYEQIIALRAQGGGTAEIADQMNMPARTIRHWLARGSAPDFRHRWSRVSAHLSSSFQAYLTERWQQGCRNVSQLDRALRSLGYKGSRRSLYRFLAPFDQVAETRGEHPPETSGTQKDRTLPSPVALTLSVQQATWLFCRKQTDLDETDQENLEQLRQAHPNIEKAYHLVSAFLQMLRERAGQQLEQWLTDGAESGLSEFESFVTGIERDKDAVLAGLTLDWSNGPTEGQVNRLKLIKRSRYGRAKFDLLRLRVLHRTKTDQRKSGQQTSDPPLASEFSPKRRQGQACLSRQKQALGLMSEVA